VTVERLAASAAPENVAEILARDGCCIVDRLVRPEVMSRLRLRARRFAAKACRPSAS
jgi:hypothetical protein